MVKSKSMDSSSVMISHLQGSKRRRQSDTHDTLSSRSSHASRETLADGYSPPDVGVMDSKFNFKCLAGSIWSVASGTWRLCLLETRGKSVAMTAVLLFLK